MPASAAAQHPIRFKHGINMKILHCLVLDLSRSQSWGSTLPARPVNDNTHQDFMADK